MSQDSFIRTKSFEERIQEREKTFPDYDFRWALSVYDYVSENLSNLIVPGLMKPISILTLCMEGDKFRLGFDNLRFILSIHTRLEPKTDDV